MAYLGTVIHNLDQESLDKPSNGDYNHSHGDNHIIGKIIVYIDAESSWETISTLTQKQTQHHHTNIDRPRKLTTLTIFDQEHARQTLPV